MNRLLYNNIWNIQKYLDNTIMNISDGNVKYYNDLDVYIIRQIVKFNPPKQNSIPVCQRGYEDIISLLNNPIQNIDKVLYTEIMNYKNHNLKPSIKYPFNMDEFYIL